MHVQGPPMTKQSLPCATWHLNHKQQGRRLGAICSHFNCLLRRMYLVSFDNYCKPILTMACHACGGRIDSYPHHFLRLAVKQACKAPNFIYQWHPPYADRPYKREVERTGPPPCQYLV